MRGLWWAIGLAMILLSSDFAKADEKLKGIACRSVHLQYLAGEGTAFYNEVTVEESAEGTYFCVCGFHRGYFGLQELADNRKVIIFSVWDPGDQNDPEAVAAEHRVQLIHRDEQVRVGRFGNEGTGGQSFYAFDWQPGTTYRFLVTAKPDGKRTEFAGYFFLPEENRWKHLVTFSTLEAGPAIKGYYSFVEDFRRNRVSATKQRTARFGNGWVKSSDGQWKALTRARFTADRNPVMNIDAGADSERFFLSTGGETKNTHAPLRSVIDLVPIALPDASNVGSAMDN